MVVLVSFALVLAAAVTLVVGLLQSGLTLIYVSIACSVVAGLVLAVAVLRGRPEPKPAAAGRPVSAPAAATMSGRPGVSSWTCWSAGGRTKPEGGGVSCVAMVQYPFLRSLAMHEQRPASHRLMRERGDYRDAPAR